MYRISIDTAHALVEVTLAGMMTVAEVDAYIAALRRAFVIDKVRPGYAIVIDVSGCPIQQQDMIEAMRAHMVAMPKARAVAVVTGSSLARMQVRRLFTQPYARITTTAAQARSWVLDGIEPTAEPTAIAAR